MKKKTIFTVLFTGFILVLSACSSPAVEPAEPASPAQPAARVVEGRLVPAGSLEHAFTMTGHIGEVLVEDGQTVTTGQVLASLTESPEANAALARARQEVLLAIQTLDEIKAFADQNLAQAKQGLIEAREAYDRAEDRFNLDDSEKNQAALDAASASLSLAQKALTSLETGGGIDPDTLAASQARLVSAEAGLTSALAYLDSRELKASMAGTVVDLSLKPGQHISAGTPAVLLADFSSWLVQTENLTELDVTGVKPGQRVEVSLDAIPGISLSGEVIHINSHYEEKRGDITYTVTIRLAERLPEARWGMTAAVRFIE